MNIESQPNGMLRNVLILEDDRDLAETYKHVLSILIHRTIIVMRSLKEMQEHRAEVLKCGIAFLDVDLGEGQPSGFDAYQWLLGEGFTGRTYFVTGHARSHPILSQVLKTQNVKLLAKPFEIQEFVDIVNGKNPSEKEKRDASNPKRR